MSTLVKSVAGPELWNDDRDGVVAKLNQIQASLGTGQGYYRDDQPPVSYDTNNRFYQFKGAVYNRLCENTDTNGIVVLVLNVPFNQLNTLEAKPKLTSALNTILGPQLGLNVIVERVKAADQQKSEVVIYACEKGGRIPALTLYKFLKQPDKMRLLEIQLGCMKIVPLVELSKSDKEKFLSTPPDGFDALLWRQYVRANPDSNGCLPHPIYGFQQLLDRQKMQQVTDVIQKAVMDENMNRLKQIEDEIAQYKSYLRSSKRVQKELSHRLLRLTTHIAQDLRQGYSLSRVEDRVLAQAEHASASLLGPNALKNRINDIQKLVETDRTQIVDYFNNVDVELTAEEERHVKQQLQIAQMRLEKVNLMLAEVRCATDASLATKKANTRQTSPTSRLFTRY